VQIVVTRSLQGKLPCENGEGLCTLEKVVWSLLQDPSVMSRTEMTSVGQADQQKE
jgi:hypothetical protein